MVKWFKNKKKQNNISNSMVHIPVNLYDFYDYEEVTRVEEQKYQEFPDRDSLYKRKDDLNEYKEDPYISKVIEHYQPYFEKGINYISQDKSYNRYLSGTSLYYYNEAFSLCTKLSIDPSPEDYFINEYYHDISGDEMEHYFIFSMVYVLLAINGAVRKQHLKMVDLIYNFLYRRYPNSLMVEDFLFITAFYQSQEIPFWQFKPQIEQFGYTALKVNEGLAEDEEEQLALIQLMRKKVYEHANHLKDRMQSQLSPDKLSTIDKEVAFKSAPLKVRLHALLGIMHDAQIGMDTKDWTKVARMAAFILDSTYTYVHNLKDKDFDLTEKAHGKYAEEVNKYFEDLDSDTRLKCKKEQNSSK